MSFATLVVLSLGLAGWYVSTRIMAAESHPVAQPVAIVAQVVEAAAPVAPAQPEPGPQAVLPLAFEYYLQIAALGTPQDAVYLKELQEKGYQAQFEAAEAGHEARILIGPYSDENANRRARDKLMGSGILAIEYIR